ncbi:zinc finger C2HC domain-containing protein 1B isoform X1 [Eurytemora carolleeae]|uniref:zinc finger C2HC domain-containing protein 1B isoform X1 n=1 Tax=Eurytemora carolleeae TaxID=1294199 RepID=UPI000C791135|nr:zinc finger C2HC domain-containing protein 1B isoform X1 [Eurytemora carolleeae]|eukprot:XP_023334315.1 zinc finger C2HC domain-containing protein 1B-like isoform X1 [Eurytemora affinis]
MGSGGSKNLSAEEHNTGRRPSQHELTNPPPQSTEPNKFSVKKGLLEVKETNFTESIMGKPENLVPCDICGRKFAEDRIERHKEICMKTTTKEREAFDVREQRLDGTEAVNYKDVEVDTEIKKADWKKTHRDIINQIKAAKRDRPASGKREPEIEILT